MKRVLLALSLVMFLSFSLIEAQTRSIRGVVTGRDDGQPIVGATVVVKGTSVGTATQLDGDYVLNVPADAEALIFAFIGMKSQEVVIGDQTVINVELLSDAIAVDEVIVVAYGTSTKGSFTGSAAVMSTEKIEKRQVSNVSEALSGAMAGVQVLSDNGQPGTSATVRIRGVGSINAKMDPLYVVDGIPYDGDLSSINSADIESMTVLKDAASTALYGARGANGIIMITTKKGKSGDAVVNLDVKVGVNSRSVKNYDVLTSPKNYLEKTYEAIYNSGVYELGLDHYGASNYANNTIHSRSAGGVGYRIYDYPAGELLIGRNGQLNPNATLGYSDGTYYYTPDNWADETFQNNLREEYNLSISKGNDDQSLYFSFGYLNDEGIVSNSGFERYSGRLKGDQKVKSWLNVGANASFNHSNSTYPGEQITTNSSGNAFFIANYIAPIYPIYVRDAEGAIMDINGRRAYDYGDGQSTNLSRSFMSIANPAGDLLYDKTNYIKNAFNSTWYAEVSPIDGLKITARYGLNVDDTKYNNLGNAYMGQSASYGGTAYQLHLRDIGFNQQYIGTYQFKIDDIHNFDITAGYDGYTLSLEELYASGQNLYNPESYYISNAIDNLRGGGILNKYATEGIISRVNYSLNDIYFANLSFRRDASSRFHKDNRWGNFWSASAAWLISSEDFMSDYDWIDMLKLKASYGEQGNDNIGNYYAWQDQYKMTGADGVFSDGTLEYKGNPDLTWETSVSYNAGIDFALFRNKVIGSLEYYGRKSVDMLYNKPVAASNGYTSMPVNVGSMTNSGVELDFTYNILKTRDINWDFFGNISLISNKINELHKDLNGKMIDGTRIYEEGHSMYRMYLVEYAGVDENTGEALYWIGGSDADGYHRYFEKTADYSIAQNRKVPTRSMLPNAYGGFGTNVTAYGFDASIQMAYQLGGQIYDSGYARLMHSGTGSYAGTNWHKDIYKAWTEDNRNTDVPRVNANEKHIANSTSTRFLTSSDYLSINNITVGYSLPKTLVKQVSIEKLRIYVAADNVALFSARRGLDPRQSFVSATTARYTPIRTISGGINLTF